MKLWTPEEMAEGEDFTAEEAEKCLEEMVEDTKFVSKRGEKYYIPKRRIPWAVKFIATNK